MVPRLHVLNSNPDQHPGSHHTAALMASRDGLSSDCQSSWTSPEIYLLTDFDLILNTPIKTPYVKESLHLGILIKKHPIQNVLCISLLFRGWGWLVLGGRAYQPKLALKGLPYCDKHPNMRYLPKTVIAISMGIPHTLYWGTLDWYMYVLQGCSDILGMRM